VIFFTGLSIDKNSQFEGSSQQVVNPTDALSVDAKGPQKKAGPRFRHDPADAPKH
jgi:hypothetical protein